MPIELRGFADALCRTAEFRDVPPAEVDQVLSDASQPLDLRVAPGPVDTPLVRSGSPFTHLVFVAEGVLYPWQFPHSELRYPFLVGDHELLMGSDRWMATYSAAPGSVVVEIPLATMLEVVEAVPQVRRNMEVLVLRRLSRFYWTSLSTTGQPASRVAAALVSRLALRGEDWGENREVEELQRALMRLTALSRTAVAEGLRSLAERGVISLAPGRYAGRVVVPDVDRLKDQALADARDAIKREWHGDAD